MASSRKTVQKAVRLNTKAVEVAIEAPPQVVEKRKARSMPKATTPVASLVKNQQEFMRSGAEKSADFHESWMAMTRHMFESNRQMFMAMLSDWWSPEKNPWLQFNYWQQFRPPQPLTFNPAPKTQTPAHNAQHDFWNTGITPVHKRVVTSPKRLTRPKQH